MTPAELADAIDVLAGTLATTVVDLELERAVGDSTLATGLLAETLLSVGAPRPYFLSPLGLAAWLSRTTTH